MFRSWAPAEWERALGFAALGLVIVGNALGNLLIKLGAMSTGPRLLGTIAWQTVAGVACFGVGILAYAWALKQFELHVAQVVVSLQYLAAIALAVWVLGEHVSPNQWIGMGLIGVGLVLCLR